MLFIQIGNQRRGGLFGALPFEARLDVLVHVPTTVSHGNEANARFNQTARQKYG